MVLLKYAGAGFFAVLLTVLAVLPLKAQQATSGSLTAQGSSLSIVSTGFSTCATQLSGTWAGTVQFQAGGNPASAFDFTGHSVGTTTQSPGMYYWASGGQASCAVTMTAFTSGSVTVGALMASQGVTFQPPGVAYVVPSDGCTATGTTFETLSCPGDPNVTIVAPTDASGNVKVNCETGCAGGGGGGNVTVVAPTNLAGQVIVTTPAPNATVFIANTPGFVCISGCSGVGNVTIVAPTSAAGAVIVTTPPPTTSLSATQGTSPWVVTTPSSNPLPTATAGAAQPAQGVEVAANEICSVPAGAAPAVTVGNRIVAQCDTTGNQKVNISAQSLSPIVVTTINPSLPAPQATFPVSCTAAANCPVNATQVTSPWVVTTPYNSPQPLPTASAGVPPVSTASYPQVAAINVCASPLGGLPALTPGNLITQMCSSAGFPEVTVCGASSGNCVGVNGNNALQIVCATANYPCGLPTPMPVAVLPTASPGVATASVAQVQSVATCVSDQATGTAISAGQVHVAECEKHGVLANGLCSNSIPCAPPIGDVTIISAVTTSLTQIIAAPGVGVSVRITAIQALGEESATGGVMDLVEGTGTNCATPVKTIPLLAIGASFTANQQVTWGNGVGQIIMVPTNTAVCVNVTAGTITTAGIVITYTVY